MKKLIIITAGLVFLFDCIFAIYVWELNINISDFLSVSFTGVAALATAYAAFSASKSASIAEMSATTWKKQMQLNVELDEAKKLKIALHTWQRHFTHEVEKYRSEELIRIIEIIQMQKQSNCNNQIQHLQRYLDEHNELWNNLEQSFDNASFIESDFEERLRLRRLSYTHSKCCNQLISYYVENIDTANDFFEIICSAIYRTSDWHELDLAGINMTKIKLEIRDANGKLVPVRKENNDYVYTSLHEDVQSWFTQIGCKIDSQITAIKSSLNNI